MPVRVVHVLLGTGGAALVVLLVTVLLLQFAPKAASGCKRCKLPGCYTMRDRNSAAARS
jgi:hypothetical protein